MSLNTTNSHQSLSNNTTIQGKVIFKTPKTLKVRVQRIKIIPKYKHAITVSKNYLVHNPRDLYTIGDVVTCVFTRKHSKNKFTQVLYT